MAQVELSAVQIRKLISAEADELRAFGMISSLLKEPTKADYVAALKRINDLIISLPDDAVSDAQGQSS